MLNTRRAGCRALVVLVVLMAAIIMAGWAAAQTAKFPTKSSVTFIVATRPGGGTDTFVRLAAPYLRNYLPERPNIIVKNMPGAEHAIGINACLRAKPDGHTLVTMLFPGDVLNEVLGLAKFDLSELAYLGTMTQVPNVLCVSAKRSERSLQDLQEASKRKPLICSTPGLATPAGAGSVIASQVLGIESEFVPNVGGAQAVLAVLRGDCDYIASSYTSFKSAVDNKQLIPIWIYSDKRFGHLPDVPTIVELGYPELVVPLQLYYGAAVSKKLPREILTIVRDAFRKTVEDPGYAKAMEKVGAYAVYTSPEDMEKVVDSAKRIYTKNKGLLEKYR